MKSSEKYSLEKEVHVDEFEIGTPKKKNKDVVSLQQKLGL